MTDQVFTLINPHNGNQAFQLAAFDENSYAERVHRNNYYSLIWITDGNGTAKVDFSEYKFKPGSLFAFSQYQPFSFASNGKLKGIVLYFHSDFFCLYKHQMDIPCGVLFNNIYQPPFVVVDEHTASVFNTLLEQLKTEMQHPALAQYELLISYLRIFLITASRLKTEQHPEAQQSVSEIKEPFILQHLKDAIEKHFKTKHSASEYADTLNMSAKGLAKITKKYFNKTLTDLISERIIIEAKRELYLTNKTVKEIAFELGYQDEYYFSRFFKTNVAISPQTYRDTVGSGRNV